MNEFGHWTFLRRIWRPLACPVTGRTTCTRVSSVLSASRVTRRRAGGIRGSITVSRAFRFSASTPAWRARTATSRRATRTPRPTAILPHEGRQAQAAARNAVRGMPQPAQLEAMGISITTGAPRSFSTASTAGSIALPATSSRRRAGRALPRPASGCHEEQDPHNGGFGRLCERCHVSSSFKNHQARRRRPPVSVRGETV